jgi:transcriptional regulator with XRE-family HTH domain
MIRSAREAKGWTQADLAAAVGVARETVGNWETGSSTPRNSLARIQNMLEVDLGAGPVGGPAHTSQTRVLLDLPNEVTEGLGALEIEEITAAARLAAFERARAIRRRMEDQ